MLSIIIINYRTPQLLAGCLQSVYDHTTDIKFEVIVLDNASGDNSDEYIRSRFPSIRWIQMSYNSGFARANNEGIKNSTGDTVLLLNSDTIVEDNAIGNCYSLFSVSDYIACGVQLLNSDRSPQISGNYFMPGSLNNLLPLPYIGPFLRRLANAISVKKPHVADSAAEVEVDWINGAFLMVKKNAIEKAGLLDEDFFLYAEEAEWCSRMKKYGKLAIYGQFRVIHLQGETSNATFTSAGKGYSNLYDRKGLQIMLSNFVRIRKQFGTAWFLFHLLIYTVEIPLFFIITTITGIFSPGRINDRLKLVKKYTANIFSLWSFAGKIISNKPYFYKVL